LKDAEKMPMQYALAFLSEKADLLLKAKAKLERERQKILMCHLSPNTKTYVTERKTEGSNGVIK
jgi:hypothetical protein